MNIEDARQALAEFELIVRKIKPNDHSEMDRKFAILLTELEILKAFFMFFIFTREAV
jgi:hypothetical protein